MRRLLRATALIRDAIKPTGNAAIGAMTVATLRATRYFDPIKTANLFGWVARLIGPLTREQRIGRANLIAAFPEKKPAEIETILAGVWDNLGRIAAEFAHLDHIWDYDPARESRIEAGPRSIELFEQLRDDGKPALQATSAIGSFPPWPPSRTGWRPPSSTGGPTSSPSTVPSTSCARSRWERWSLPAPMRR
jgi:KDO2-lipid IV(A) lauroyltransferase